MRIIFAGTPEFARVALQALHAAGHDIALVLTQPDRPGGRGLKLQASPVKQFAQSHGIAVCQPRSLRLEGKYPDDARAAQEAIAAARAEVMIVAAYGLILPQWVLEAFQFSDGPPLGKLAPSGGSDDTKCGSVGARFGCLNIHASLLPRWRGAAPIHRAIEAGDAQTGITIMQMDAGLDTGDMLLTGSMPILPTDTTGSLHDRLATMGGELILRALDLAATGQLQPRPQPKDANDPQITYAAKIDKAEASIDWAQPAEVIVRRIRAFNPAPGASSMLHGEVLKIWEAEAAPASPPEPGKPPVAGQIVSLALAGIAVTAINSIVNITALQKPGGRRLSAADFLRGAPLKVGDCFEPAAKAQQPG